LIFLKKIDDFPDGSLIIANEWKDIPFKIKRVYWITNLDKSIRGRHAHKTLKQAIFCIKGHFTLLVDNGVKKVKFLMNKNNVGILITKEWHTLMDFSKDCVVLVFASDYYNENDYIRDYTEFKKEIEKCQRVELAQS